MPEFFEPPPPSERPPAPPRYRQPEWFGPPRGTLPGVLPLALLLVRNDEVAISVLRVDAYPSGFGFDLLVMLADDTRPLDPMGFAYGRRPRGDGEDVPASLLRVGVQFADGAKATNVAAHHFPAPGQRPDPPVLHPGGGGGGGGGQWHQRLWVWPLPPPGPLAFVCEWPEVDIPLTRREIDAQEILDASARAHVIFSDDHLPEWPSE